MNSINTNPILILLGVGYEVNTHFAIFWAARNAMSEFHVIRFSCDTETFDGLSHLLESRCPSNEKPQFIELRFANSRPINGRCERYAWLQFKKNRIEASYMCSERFAQNLHWFLKSFPDDKLISEMRYQTPSVLPDLAFVRHALTTHELWIANHDGCQYEIAEDRELGFYVYRFEAEVCTHDYLQGNLIAAFECALEEFGVPINCWILRSEKS